MRELSWSDCLENKTARKVSCDFERANSLIETAIDRISIINDVNQKNCNFVFEDYYTSIIEILQAIVINNGFNIVNHLSNLKLSIFIDNSLASISHIRRNFSL